MDTLDAILTGAVLFLAAGYSGYRLMGAWRKAARGCGGGCGCVRTKVAVGEKPVRRSPAFR